MYKTNILKGLNIQGKKLIDFEISKEGAKNENFFFDYLTPDYFFLF